MSESEAKEKLQAYIKCQESQEPADVLEQCDKECDYCELCYAQGLYEEHKEAVQMAINALEEIQQYRTLEKRLLDMFGGSLTLEAAVDSLELALKEPDSPHPMNARILTYKESADWDAYRAIGTLEECREAMEKQAGKLTVDEAKVIAAKAICIGCGYLDDCKCNYKGSNCGVSQPMLQSVMKAFDDLNRREGER